MSGADGTRRRSLSEFPAGHAGDEAPHAALEPATDADNPATPGRVIDFVIDSPMLDAVLADHVLGVALRGLAERAVLRLTTLTAAS